MDWRDRYGPWALVTGASAGLGAEFVRQLAAEGLNIVLVARRADRMEALADRVSDAHGVRTRVLQLDLTGHDACARVGEGTRDLEVGLLVNNAGYGLSGAYHVCDPGRQAKMAVLNCVVPVLLTNHFLPAMLDRGRGGIIFLASTAAFQATPYFAAYGATKTFNLMLGEALWKECRPQGVDVLALSPGFTKTEFSQVAGIRDAGAFREATPEPVVSAALKSLGKRPSVVHGAVNKILTFIVRLLPRRTTIAIAGAALKARSIAHG
jgi:short-subunit dehydrogenase